jgi:DNA polymerase III alpha subunit
MLFEYDMYSKFTDKEQLWVKRNVCFNEVENLEHMMEIMLVWYNSHAANDKNRPFHTLPKKEKAQESFKTLQSPPYSLEDSPDWIARVEEARLGINLTASILDMCIDRNQANCSCQDFISHNEHNSGIFIAAQIDEIKMHTTINGDEMAFVTISDDTAIIDAVIFPKDWENISKLGVCIEENTVMISGERSNKDSLIIKNMWQLT